MAILTQGKTQADYFFVTQVAQKAMAILRAKTVFCKTMYNDADINTQFKADFKRGDVVNIRTPNAYTVLSKSEDTVVTREQYTASGVSLTLNTHSYVAIAVEDIAEALEGTWMIRDGEVNSMAWALVKALEVALASLYSDVTTNVVGTGASLITPENLRAAAVALDDQECPDEGRHVALTPSNVYALIGDDDMQMYMAVAQAEAIKQGVIGEMYGFKVHKTPRIQTAASVYYNLAYHESAFGFATRSLAGRQSPGAVKQVLHDAESGMALRAVYAYDADYLADTMTIDHLYGVKTLREACAVQIKTSA